MSVEYTSADGVGVLTLQRPPANSYDADFVDALRSAVAEATGGGVVAVVVRQRDPPDAAAPARLRDHRRDVVAERRARVDDPARVAPDHPGVRPVERERPRVVGGDERDVASFEGIGHCCSVRRALAAR